MINNRLVSFLVIFSATLCLGLIRGEFYSLAIAAPDSERQQRDFVRQDVGHLYNRSSLKVVFGSCLESSDTPIWKEIAKHSPEIILFLGDNIYLTESQFGNGEVILQAYKQQFLQPELSKLISTTPTFAIWNDHDFGPNNSDSTFSQAGASRRAFREFWKPAPSPTELGAETIARVINFKNFKIILTDDRTFRISHEKKVGRTLFGRKQLDWIKRELINATQKVVIFASSGQIISETPFTEMLGRFPEEQAELLSAMEKSPAKVIVLSGDRHHAETLERAVGQKIIHEFSSSPLNAGLLPIEKHPKETFRKKAIFGSHNFGVLSIELKEEALSFSVHFYDAGGRILHQESY